jgi:CO/xanthine dehydrogenase FAD-binding subunit
MDLTTIADVVTPRSRADIPPPALGDALLAGGTWVFSEPQLLLRRLVDLTTLGWPALEANDSGLTISATCRIAELFGWTAPLAWPAAKIIPDCCHCLLGSFKIWNAATVGGNICLALPAGPMTALTVALDGLATIWKPDGAQRDVKIIDLVVGNNRNSLAAGEIMRSVFLPASAFTRRAAFRQMSLSPVGRSAALLIATSGAAGDFALTITAATPHPVRLDFATIPTGEVLRDAIENAVTASGKWFDDMHGAPDWRRHITHHLAAELRREMDGEI